MLEMTDIAPGVGPRDDPAKVADQVWKNCQEVLCRLVPRWRETRSTHGKGSRYTDRVQIQTWPRHQTRLNYFLAVFTFEMIAKIIAMGFIGPAKIE